jgi:hypothetical protein
MLAAVASGDFASIPAAMSALDPGPKASITPGKPNAPLCLVCNQALLVLVYSHSALTKGGEDMPDVERDRVRAYHDAKHAVFHDMHAHQLAYRRLMADVS